jgi:putative pyruvate formate lyase activating enzyme
MAKAVSHLGEEPAISGTRGSGTIFFSYCNLKCCFCQNFQISQEALGSDVSVEELCDMMLNLQAQGCHNINLVSASHFLPFVVKALWIASGKGLRIPTVYNSNGYEDAEALRMLDGIIDVYLPDVKYADDSCAQKYSGAKNYSNINLKALEEMFRQGGYLEVDEAGIAVKGLIVRHLVLPGRLAETGRILEMLKNRFGHFLAVSLMGQYRPCYHASAFPELCAGISRKEYEEAVGIFEALGFESGWVQEFEGLDGSFVPDFQKRDSWN